MEQKYSLFQIERSVYPAPTIIGEFNSSVVEQCFCYLKTFDSIEEAKKEQKDCPLKTIILTSY